MPLVRRETPNGPTFTRPRFRPEDYVVPEGELQRVERGRDFRDVDDELDERDGTLSAYRLVERFQRGGQTWALLQHTSADYCLEIEVTELAFGEVRAVEPRRAYELARARDQAERPSVVQSE